MAEEKAIKERIITVRVDEDLEDDLIWLCKELRKERPRFEVTVSSVVRTALEEGFHAMRRSLERRRKNGG